MRRTDDLREAHLHEEPVAMGGADDPRLESAAPALLRGLEKDPAKRYATCGELCAAVYAAVAPVASDRREPTIGERAEARAATQLEHPSSERLWHSAEQETEPELTPAPPASAPPATVAAPSAAVDQAAATADESRPPPARRPLRRRLAAVLAVAALGGLGLVLALVLGGGGDDGAAKVVPSVAVGTPTADAFAADGSVWFAGQDGNLRRVDAASAKTVGAPLRVIDEPYRLAGAGTTIWTIGSKGSQASQVDAATAHPTAHTVDLPSVPYDVAVGEGAAWVAANPPGARGNGQLIELDPLSGRIRTVQARASLLVGVATGHHAVWILEESRGLLRRLSPQALTTVAEIPVGATSSSVVVADARAVWVANGEAGRLLRIDPRSNRVVKEIAVRPSDDVGLAAGGGAVWWIDKPRGTVSRIDTEDDRLVGSPLRVGGQLGGAAVSGHTLWVAKQSAPSVARIRF
jgi:streptogramin lyase